MKARCPVCRQPATAEHRPFCSRSCKDRDLLQWLDDGYRIPGPAADPDAPVANDALDKDSGRD